MLYLALLLQSELLFFFVLDACHVCMYVTGSNSQVSFLNHQMLTLTAESTLSRLLSETHSALRVPTLVGHQRHPHVKAMEAGNIMVYCFTLALVWFLSTLFAYF